MSSDTIWRMLSVGASRSGTASHPRQTSDILGLSRRRRGFISAARYRRRGGRTWPPATPPLMGGRLRCGARNPAMYRPGRGSRCVLHRGPGLHTDRRMTNGGEREHGDGFRRAEERARRGRGKGRHKAQDTLRRRLAARVDLGAVHRTPCLSCRRSSCAPRRTGRTVVGTRSRNPRQTEVVRPPSMPCQRQRPPLPCALISAETVWNTLLTGP